MAVAGRNTAQGVVAEKIAKAKLARQGFKYIHRGNHAWGADFMATKNGRKYLIEVKSGQRPKNHPLEPKQLETKKLAAKKGIGYKVLIINVDSKPTQKRITKLAQKYKARRTP